MSVCSKEDDFFLFWEIDMEGMTRFILGILHFRLCKYTGFQVASAGYKIKVYLISILGEVGNAESSRVTQQLLSM